MSYTVFLDGVIRVSDILKKKINIFMYYFTEPNNSSSIPDTPHRVFLPRFASNWCGKSWKMTIHETQICAGGKKGIDSCTEDSGNPLLRHIRNEVYVEGIVSGGLERCGEINFPGIYIYIPKFIDWIKFNIYT